MKVTLHYWDMHRDVPQKIGFKTIEEGLNAMYKAKSKGHYNVRLTLNGNTIAR